MSKVPVILESSCIVFRYFVYGTTIMRVVQRKQRLRTGSQWFSREQLSAAFGSREHPANSGAFAGRSHGSPPAVQAPHLGISRRFHCLSVSP